MCSDNIMLYFYNKHSPIAVPLACELKQLTATASMTYSTLADWVF